MIIRWLLSFLIRPFLPMLARRDFRQQHSYLKDCGTPEKQYLPYASFLNEYLKELRVWIRTGKFE